MRNGKYGSYNGKEYRISEEINGVVTLVSNDPNDLKLGFEKYHRRPSVFIKKVEKSELRSMFRITSFAIIDGTKFEIVGIGSNDVVIYTYDEVVANKYDMERTGINEYKKTLDIKGLKVLEEKTLIDK